MTPEPINHVKSTAPLDQSPGLPASPDADEAKPIVLKAVAIDWSTFKTQMVVAIIVAVVACWSLYWKTLKTGFLLDDFLHLDYVARAMAGNWQPLLNNFTGNWAGSDVMRSYRPLVTLSIFADYLIYNAHSGGYHVTNILLTCACAILVALVTAELTGLRGNRLGAAAPIWAGLLFAFCPLHPEAAAWMIGRVDLLCCLFYLSCVFFYLRFRLLKEQGYFFLALVSFALAFLSKEMAVTIPVTITVAEIFLYDRSTQVGRAHGLTSRLIYPGLLWFAFCIAASLRFLVLGTMVGGYGADHGLSLRDLAIFADKSTLLKIVFPLNEEIFRSQWLKPAMMVGYCAALASLAARLVLGTAHARTIIFLALWTVVTVLPTFQIWHIYPNLVGSRLFFIGSAPLCILLSLAALPAIDALPRRFVTAAAIVGTAALALIAASWAVALDGNLKPWQSAGAQMRNLRQELARLAKALPQGKRILLVDLPTDVSGAGLLTRPAYLKIAMAPPLASENYGDRIATAEITGPGSHDYIWPATLRKMIGDPRVALVLAWDKTGGRYEKWTPGAGDTCFHFGFNPAPPMDLLVDPPSVVIDSPQKWRVVTEQLSCLTAFKDSLRIYPGKQAVTIYFPPVSLDPLKADVAAIKFSYTSTTGSHEVQGNQVKLVWEGERALASVGAPTEMPLPVAATATDAPPRVEPVTGQARISAGASGTSLVWLGRYKTWSLCRRIKRLGIRCESGQYFADLKSLDIIPDTVTSPESNLSIGNHATTPIDEPVHVRKSNSAVIFFDSTHVPGACGTRLITGKTNTTYDISRENQMGLPELSSADELSVAASEMPVARGKSALPAQLFSQPGLHCLRFVALDKNKQISGLPGEPISIFVDE